MESSSRRERNCLFVTRSKFRIFEVDLLLSFPANKRASLVVSLLAHLRHEATGGNRACLGLLRFFHVLFSCREMEIDEHKMRNGYMFLHIGALQPCTTEIK